MILPISVIIPTMNRPESLDRTLKSISEASDLPQQIVVVDQSCEASVQDSNRKMLQNILTLRQKYMNINQLQD